MGFVYRVLQILKALRIVLSETINILWNCKKNNNIFGMPLKMLLYVYVHSLYIGYVHFRDAPENVTIRLCT